jgi:hypothetical protein
MQQTHLRRGHYELATDASPPLRLAAAFSELAFGRSWTRTADAGGTGIDWRFTVGDRVKMALLRLAGSGA